ncbi:hypothetical protein GOBAR_DD02982 [Gossypium barbadense]|nr:hypothetical protein GOBAR_DD02982 [Gossypium barbadense]
MNMIWGFDFYPFKLWASTGLNGLSHISRTKRAQIGSKPRHRWAFLPWSIWKEIRQFAKMQNEEGQNMDLYIPRKCSATNRLITSKDHASVQINVGHLDELGRYTGTFSTFALCGFVRAQGDADSALDRLWQKKKAEVRQQ